MTPRAGVDRVDGVDESGVLRLRVRAIPDGGKANDAVQRLLAKELDIGVTRVTIGRGHSSRTKQVAVDAADAAGLELRWPGLSVRS